LSVARVAVEDDRGGASRRASAEIAGWAALALLAVVGVPLFLRMGPWVDVTHYDLAARNVLQGGVHYRDIFDTNLPGMVWLHVVIRSAFGWSFEAIRAVDLLMVAASAILLVRWLAAAGAPRVAGVWTATAIAAFYLSTPEWSHCQRDVWMLPLALGAASLRLRQVGSLQLGADARPLAARGFAEGVCWALAAWIKPFVVVPAAAVWLASAGVVRGRASRAHIAADAAGVIGGGLLTIAAGTAWLAASGAWPHFWDVMLRWNPEYVGGHAYHWHARWDAIRLWMSVSRPWCYTLLVALAVALAALGARRAGDPAKASESHAIRILAAFVLGWFLQAALLQPRAHPYVMDAAVLVGLPLLTLGMIRVHAHRRLAARAILVAFVALAAARHPLLRIDRLALLGQALEGRDAAGLRDRLSLHAPASVGRVRWAQLEQTASFLRSAGAKDGEVLCFNEAAHPLYLMLDLRPPVRYLQFGMVIHTMTRRREEARREMDAARPRFIVSDARGAARFARDGSPQLAPAWRGLYPWTQPVVFQAGPYSVHRVVGPVTRFWP
jgi:hypothetical protein